MKVQMEKLTVDQLKQLATENNIKGRSKLRKKSELLKELRKIPELVEMYDNNTEKIGEPETPHRFNPETPRPVTPPAQNIPNRKERPTPAPRKNIPNRKERPTPAPRKNIPDKKSKVTERIKFFEALKDTKHSKKTTEPRRGSEGPKKIFKNYKVEDRKKFYDSITVTTNENLPNKQKRNIIKNYKVEDRKKFYESLKNLTNKKIIKKIPDPRKKVNNQTQNKTEPVENKDKKNKLRPPTNFKFIPFGSEPDEMVGQNNIVINADLNNDISQIIMDSIRPEIQMRTRVVYGFKSNIHRGKGEIVNQNTS